MLVRAKANRRTICVIDIDAIAAANCLYTADFDMNGTYRPSVRLAAGPRLIPIMHSARTCANTAAALRLPIFIFFACFCECQAQKVYWTNIVTALALRFSIDCLQTNPRKANSTRYDQVSACIWIKFGKLFVVLWKFYETDACTLACIAAVKWPYQYYAPNQPPHSPCAQQQRKQVIYTTTATQPRHRHGLACLSILPCSTMSAVHIRCPSPAEINHRIEHVEIERHNDAIHRLTFITITFNFSTG